MLSLLIAVVLPGCQSAEFRAAYSAPQSLSLSCSTNPLGAVIPGSPLSIIVGGAKGYKGRIEQKISGPQSSTITLVVSDDGLISREDLAENVFTFSEEGDYRVDLKGLDYNVDLQSSCQFTVFDKCPASTKRVGVNVVFVVDNSYSHRESDCTNPRLLGARDEAGHEKIMCTAKTSREIAVEEAVSVLKDIGHADNQAKSFISFASFPKQSGKSSGKWYDTSGSVSGLLSEIKVLRTPLGVTPYDEGIQQALKLLASAPDKTKQNVLVFITDGFPTDRNPHRTHTLAKTLGRLDVEMIAVMVTGERTQPRLRRIHRGFMEGFPKDWISSRYPNKDAYFLDLLGNGTSQKPGLLQSMTENPVIYINSSRDLRSKINDIVTHKVLSCR